MQTGYPHRYIHVYKTSTTRITGRAPYVGEPIAITATGSWLTSLTALTITQTTGATSRPDPPAAPSLGAIPAHIPTWAYDEYWSIGARGTAAQVRAYVTYAQGGPGNAKAVSDCKGSSSCKSVAYFNSHFFYDNSVCGAMSPVAKGIHDKASENWFVHLTGHIDEIHRLQGRYSMTCKGHAVTIPVYALNNLTPGVRSYFAQYLHTYASGFDEFFLDDTSGAVFSQFYGPGGGFCAGRICSSTQEMRTNAAVVSEHGALATSLTHPDGTSMRGVFNGLNFTDGRPNDLAVLTSSANFYAAVCEGCVVSAGKPRPAMFAPVLNAMAEINAIPGKSFVELSNGSLVNGSAAQLQARALTTAMAWLGYSEGHTIVWPSLEQNTPNLAVFAENSLYPSSPIETMTTGASNLQVAANVYRREFRACYYNRVAIGPCAAIVNGSGRNVAVSSAWLHQTYGHVVQLIGGDIPSGGRIALTSATFSANRTYVGPSQALMIVR
jgi:hypothetical protein